MDITRTAGGALRVLLSNSDLKRFGTDFASLDERDPQTRAVIKRILHAVLKKTPFKETAVLVEAVPTDDGCLLLITPRTHATDNVYAVLVADDNALLSLGTAISPNGFAASALYRLPDGYGLLLYCEQTEVEVAALLHEFGKVHIGSVPAAAIKEYGRPLIIGDALERMHRLH